MSEDDSIGHPRNPKANMDHIYNQADPRAYFSELHKLDYATPGAGKPFFLSLIERLRRSRDKSVRVLDLGCSYGVNGALLKHDMTMPELYEHWGHEELQDLSPEEVMARDRRFFASREEAHELEVIGLDRAERAVAFAEETGLIDDGVVANFEEHPLSDALMPDLADVDLLTSTGCIGYVTEKTFERLLPAVTKGGQAPWMANFALRLWSFEPIEETLSDWGYVTEKLEDRTFRQRRFVSDEEREQVLEQLRERGIDPSGKEAEGHLHTEFYLSRPADDVGHVPLTALLPGKTSLSFATRVGPYLGPATHRQPARAGWLIATRGHGLIAPQDGPKDVFVHIAAMERAGPGTLREAERLTHQIRSGRDRRTGGEELSATDQAGTGGRATCGQLGRPALQAALPSRSSGPGPGEGGRRRGRSSRSPGPS